MLTRIMHSTTYRYATPASSVIQILRQTPRNHDGQFVANWRVDISANCRVHQHEDAFGNICHSFTAEGPLDELAVGVEGEVETRDTAGIVGGTVERFPPSLYLRETGLTKPDRAILKLAADIRTTAGNDVLPFLHRVVEQVHQDMELAADASYSMTTAAEAFELKRGAYQDFTHIFIAVARSANIPARYISGHFRDANGARSHDPGHAWAEAYVPDLGWVAFDAANGICTTDAHVRVAAGLDYLGAAPVRGSRHGGSGETRTVDVQVDHAMRQAQS